MTLAELENQGHFKAAPRHKYPHFLPSDVDIWDRFLKKHRKKFVTVDYDIHVGDGRPVDPRHPANIRAMTKSLTQLRIDVIGYNAEGYTIIEVKAWPGVSAIGQIICYKDLYLKQYQPNRIPNLLLISNEISPDIRYCCSSNYIESIVV